MEEVLVQIYLFKLYGILVVVAIVLILIIENKKDSSRKNNKIYDEPGVLLASYNLNQDAIRVGNLDDKTRFEEIKRQVEAVHGLKKGYLDSVVKDSKTVDWNREKGFYGAFCYFMTRATKTFFICNGKTRI